MWVFFVSFDKVEVGLCIHELIKFEKVEKKFGRHFRAQGTLNRGGSGIPYRRGRQPSRRGRQPSRRGRQPTIVSKISKKLHEIAKILGCAATAEVNFMKMKNIEPVLGGREGAHAFKNFTMYRI